MNNQIDKLDSMFLVNFNQLYKDTSLSISNNFVEFLATINSVKKTELNLKTDVIQAKKDVLNSDKGLSLNAGYLAYNKYLVEGLSSVGYLFNSSSSANNVLTNFPYQSHIGLSTNEQVSSLYEIPNTISDVFKNNPISETNYNDKVDTWIDVQHRNAANYSPTIFMLHPNRSWKIIAQERLIRNLSENTAIITFSEYGDFWKDREKCNFWMNESSDSIIQVVIADTSLPLNDYQSFIVNNGKNANSVIVLSESGDTIPMIQSSWRDNDLILYYREFTDQYDVFDYHEDQVVSNFLAYPNPFSETIKFQYILINDAQVKLKIYDFAGRLIDSPFDDYLELGPHVFDYENSSLSEGVYFYTLQFNEEKTLNGKIIFTK